MTESDNTPVEGTSEAPPPAPENTTGVDLNPVPDVPGTQEAVSDDSQAAPSEEAPELSAAPVSGAVSDPSAVSDEEQVQPNNADVPVDDKAEPKNAETTHEATPEQVEVQE